jgi:pimeloyl-ACP methyl ester carboxylesterase
MGHISIITFMPEQFPFIDVGDQRISYQKTGSGPPLLCLHGLAGYERTYDSILSYFNPHFTVYQLAWPGYGSAPLRGSHYTINDMVRWVESFRKHFGFTKVYLMGNCIGANVALEYTYQHPDRPQYLILNEPHAFMPVYFYLLFYPVIGNILLSSIFKTRVGRAIIMRAFPLEEATGTGYTERRLVQVPLHAMHAFLRALYLYARETDLYARPKLDVPTVFPLPRNTFGQVAAFENLYARCFTNLEITIVEGEVHNPVVEDPKAFSQALLPRLGIGA